MDEKFDGLNNDVQGAETSTEITTAPTMGSTTMNWVNPSCAETSTEIITAPTGNVDPVTEQQPKEQRTPTDPNKITVQVSDKNAPIIILLFGAPSSGKTMTLVRLSRYLRKKGFSVSVDPRFVTTKDVWEYAENSAKFNKMLDATTALPGTGRNDFLFIKICDNRGKLICQILEGAGEDYFPSSGTNRSQTPFPSYMTGIFNSGNKKVWMFLTEPDWDVNQIDRDAYVQRIAYCKNQFFHSKRDKSIILYNKINKTDFVYGPGQVHVKNAMTYCNNEYQGLFQIFRNPSPLPWADKYTCKFVPFSTGVFGETTPGQYGHYDQLTYGRR